MEDNRRNVSLQEIRDMDLVSYLANLGHEPSKIRNNDFWYLSPLRDETVPSFKVNRRINRWYDHGMGRGGNLIDFAILYKNCSLSEFLAGFRNGSPVTMTSTRALRQRPARRESGIKIVEQRSLRSDSLLRYIQERRVSVHMADRYCRELNYEISGNRYLGIGFPNDGGGFEIRSPDYKLGSSPKDISSHGTGSSEILVFEGFMDFLTFRTLHPEIDESRVDFMVLNSVSFFERAREKMETHQQISLYLDRDRAGSELTMYALSLDDRYRDQSILYKNHKDLNDWAMNPGRLAAPAQARRISR